MRHPTAVIAACFTLAAATAIPSVRADGPTSRPVNQVTVVQGTIVEADTPLSDYGGTIGIAGAPLAAGTLRGVRVADYLRTLQARVPHFRYIIRRDGVSADYAPVLPDMETTDLTLGELVNYVNQNCPGVQVRPDDSVSPTDPLYVVTLSEPHAAKPALDAPRVVRAVSIRAAVQVQQRVRHEDERAALTDVMSLVQALVDTSPDGGGVKLKLHEPTGMLIVDAPTSLSDAIAAAIETMSRLSPESQRQAVADSSWARDVARHLAALQQKHDELQSRLDKLRAIGLGDRNPEVVTTARAIKDVADQMAQAEASTRPTPAGN